MNRDHQRTYLINYSNWEYIESMKIFGGVDFHALILNEWDYKQLLLTICI